MKLVSNHALLVFFYSLPLFLLGNTKANSQDYELITSPPVIPRVCQPEALPFSPSQYEDALDTLLEISRKKLSQENVCEGLKEGERKAVSVQEIIPGKKFKGELTFQVIHGVCQLSRAEVIEKDGAVRCGPTPCTFKLEDILVANLVLTTKSQIVANPATGEIERFVYPARRIRSAAMNKVSSYWTTCGQELKCQEVGGERTFVTEDFSDKPTKVLAEHKRRIEAKESSSSITIPFPLNTAKLEKLLRFSTVHPSQFNSCSNTNDFLKFDILNEKYMYMYTLPFDVPGLGRTGETVNLTDRDASSGATDLTNEALDPLLVDLSVTLGFGPIQSSGSRVYPADGFKISN